MQTQLFITRQVPCIKTNGSYQSFTLVPFKSIKYNVQNAVEKH